MDPSLSSLLALDAAIMFVLLTAWLYFRRVRVERPPVGVFNLRDVTFTFIVLVIIPHLYLDLPRWLVASILVLMAAGLSYLTLVPVLGSRIAITAVGGLAAGEITLTVLGVGQSTGFVVLNDIAVGLLVVGVCNIWAQSGIRARDVTVFACAVGVFDLVATWLMPLMLEFFTRVRALPFAPMLAVGNGGGAVVIGMGDLLFIVLWPLVTVKAFAGRAGLVAATGTVGCVMVLDVAFYTGLLNSAVPAMVFIAPVILVQYLLFRRRYRVERTTGEYEAATRADVPAPTPPPALPVADLTAALALIGSGDGGPGQYLAVHDGAVIGAGPTPGAAATAARKTAPGVTPVLVLGDKPLASKTVAQKTMPA
jgi:hypothetical protein